MMRTTNDIPVLVKYKNRAINFIQHRSNDERFIINLCKFLEKHGLYLPEETDKKQLVN